VVFGLQPFIKTFLIDFFNVNFFDKTKEKIKNEYVRVIRHTFGWALKSTYCKINGTSIQIFKDPKTDDGTKKSQKGCVVVYEKDGVYTWEDQKEFIEASIDPNNKLQPIFRNGKLLIDDTLSAIRERLKKHMLKCIS